MKEINLLLSIPGLKTVDDAAFTSDTEILIFSKTAAYKYDITSQTAVFLDTADSPTSQLNTRSLKAPNLPVIIKKDFSTYITAYMYNKTSGTKFFFRNLNSFIGYVTLLDKSASNQVWIYTLYKVNFVLCYSFDTTTEAFALVKGKVESPVKEVESNILVHPTLDLVVFSGLVATTYRALHLFRDHMLNDLFQVDADYYFDFAEFVPGANSLVAYYAGGEFCAYDFDLVGQTMTKTACQKAFGTVITPQFISPTRFVGIFQASLALFEYPSLQMLQLYSTQPSSSTVVSGTKFQLHTFNNLYVRLYDMEKHNYIQGRVYEGKVRSTIASRALNERQIAYIADDEQFLKKINILTYQVLETYNPLTEVVTPAEIATYRDWALKGIDFYFEDNQRILVTYESYRIADDKRFVTLITYTMASRTGVYYIFELANPHRTAGAICTRNYGAANDIVGISGAHISFYDITPTNPLRPEFRKYMQNVSYNSGNAAYTKMADVFFAQRINSIQKKDLSGPTYDVVSCFTRYHNSNMYDADPDLLGTVDPNSSIYNDNRWYKGYATNSFDEIIYQKDSSGIDDYKILNTGTAINIFSIEYTNRSVNSIYGLIDSLVRDATAGVAYPSFSQGIYFFRTTEDTLYKYDTLNCPADLKDDFIENRLHQQAPNCQNQLMFNPEVCILCDANHYIGSDGTCVAGTCSSLGKYDLDTECYDHCPFGYYKTPDNFCLSNCSSHATAQKTFGDMCVVSCPAGSTDIAGQCVCDGITKARETGTCVTSCTPYFSVHYQMCLNQLRTDTQYNVDEFTIYCPVGLVYDPPTKKCVQACDPNTTLNSKSTTVGDICVTPQECKDSGKIVNSKHLNCVEECPEGDFYDPLLKTCSLTCDGSSLYFSEKDKCFMRCDVCESCETGYFLNNAKKCIRACTEDEYLIETQNICGTCEQGCHICEKNSGTCLKFKFSFEIVEKVVPNQSSDIIFLTYILDRNKKIILPSEIDPEMKELQLYNAQYKGSELQTKTYIQNDQFVTFGNFTSAVSSGTSFVDIELRINVLGSTGEVSLVEEKKSLRIFKEKEDSHTIFLAENISKYLGIVDNILEIMTYATSLCNIIFLFDPTGVLFRFPQVVRTLMRFRYINIQKGEQMRSFFSNMAEIHDPIGQKEYSFSISKGRLSEYKVSENIALQIPYKLGLYSASWLFKISLFVLYYITSKKMQKSRGFRFFKGFVERSHFISFNILLIDGMFYGTYNLIHYRYVQGQEIWKLVASLVVILLTIDILLCIRQMIQNTYATEYLIKQHKSQNSITSISSPKTPGRTLNQTSNNLMTESTQQTNSPIAGLRRLNRNLVNRFQDSRLTKNTSLASINLKTQSPEISIQQIITDRKTKLPIVELYVESEQAPQMKDVEVSIFGKVEKYLILGKLGFYQVIFAGLSWLPFWSLTLIVVIEVPLFFSILLTNFRYSYLKNRYTLLTKLVSSASFMCISLTMSILAGAEYYQRDSFWESYNYYIQTLVLVFLICAIIFEYIFLVVGILGAIFYMTQQTKSKNKKLKSENITPKKSQLSVASISDTPSPQKRRPNQVAPRSVLKSPTKPMIVEADDDQEEEKEAPKNFTFGKNQNKNQRKNEDSSGSGSIELEDNLSLSEDSFNNLGGNEFKNSIGIDEDSFLNTPNGDIDSSHLNMTKSPAPGLHEDIEEGSVRTDPRKLKTKRFKKGLTKRFNLELGGSKVQKKPIKSVRFYFLMCLGQ